MATNTSLWDKLGKTDPKHTKAFSRAGGFKGTAIKPMWAFHRMTEEFGACGVGWGVNEPSFQVVPSDGEILVYCTASIWHGQRDHVVFGVGGDKVATKRRDGGVFVDDEAFKKSFTDAITNALKLIGVGADVHMGMFDDNKYVNALKAEFEQPQQEQPRRENPHVTRPEDIFDPGADQDIEPQSLDVNALSKAKAKALFAELQTSLWKCGSVEEMKAWNTTHKPQLDLLPNDWFMMLKGVYAEHKAEIIKQAARDDERVTG